MFNEKSFIRLVVEKICKCDFDEEVFSDEELEQKRFDVFQQFVKLYETMNGLGYKLDLGEKKPSEKFEEFVKNKSIGVTKRKPKSVDDYYNKEYKEECFSATICLENIEDGKIVIKSTDNSKIMQQIFIDKILDESNSKVLKFDTTIIELDESGLFILKATEAISEGLQLMSLESASVYFYSPESLDYMTSEQQINETFEISDIAKIIEDPFIGPDYFREFADEGIFKNPGVIDFYHSKQEELGLAPRGKTR